MLAVAGDSKEITIENVESPTFYRFFGKTIFLSKMRTNSKKKKEKDTGSQVLLRSTTKLQLGGGGEWAMAKGKVMR